MIRLAYGEESIDCSLRHSDRLERRIRIHVLAGGAVEVEAAASASRDEISRALSRRARWIFAALADGRDVRRFALPRSWRSGETHFYLGRRYKLVVRTVDRSRSSVKLLGGRLEVILPVADPVAIRRRVGRWYRERAIAYFARKLPELAGRFDWVDATPSFRLVPMKKQWGSCSPEGSLSINPALIRAPAHCVEYVLIHELCHLVEHNHGQRFYGLLERSCPTWREWKAELDSVAEMILAE